MHQNSSSQVKKNTYPPTKDFRDFGVAEIHKCPEKKTLYLEILYPQPDHQSVIRAENLYVSILSLLNIL